MDDDRILMYHIMKYIDETWPHDVSIQELNWEIANIRYEVTIKKKEVNDE